MADFLGHWCRLATGTGIRALKTMAKTLSVHATGILNWWEHRISNGRMEGLNNKIKAMLRLHYGLRDERFLISASSTSIKPSPNLPAVKGTSG